MKGPKIFKIHVPDWVDSYDHGEEGVVDHKVRITHRQYMRLPYWVRRFTMCYSVSDNAAHVDLLVEAKDELEAMMRFKRMWAGLVVMAGEEMK